MTTPKEPKERLLFFSSLYERAKSRHRETLSELSRHREQYLGSDEIDGSPVRASAVRNITYEIIEGQVSSDIPAPRVAHAGFTPEGERCAVGIERLLLRMRDELPFERLNDLDERYTTVFGGSVWLVEWDATRTHPGETGGIRLSCLSPEDLIPEPDIPEIEDMEYCFLRFLTPRAELCRRFGVSPAEAALGECETEGEREDEDTVTVVICFFREEDGAVSRFVFSGDAVLSDLPDYYGRKEEVCPRCGAPSGCACGDRPTLRPQREERIPLPGGEVSVPYYRPRRFPLVVRKNVSRAGRLLGQSDCEVIRPQQQAINKLESRIQQKLMRSGVTPVMPEDARVAPDNSVFGQVIRLGPGETTAQYGIIDTTPDVSQEILQSDRLYEQAKRLIGVTDSLLGLSDSTATSGYAKRLQIEQAAGRLESKRRMKQAAYADIDRLIFTLHLAFADEARATPYLDGRGHRHHASFDRYDFLVYDAVRGEYVFDDSFLFSADRNGGLATQRDLLWEENLKNLRSGTLGDPTSPHTLLRYWQLQERAHYPNARENVEYFEELAGRAAEGGDVYGKEHREAPVGG